MDILTAAKRHNMFSPGDSVLVAVSGGPDSVAMLHALHTHSQELGISLHVAHFNHGIRGEQSNLDQVFVTNLAHTFGLPIAVGEADVPALRAELRVGEEEAARIARLGFLRETAATIGANKIALGHTADDRAESVLLNIIRGCGIDGLGSIKPTNGNIVRPLIDTSRTDIEQYIAENALPYRIDESNADTSYTRNRVRHELIPLLEHEYNPEIKGALLRLARIASAQGELLDGLAQSALTDATRAGGLDAASLASLPEALLYQAIRCEIERTKGDLRDISLHNVQSVVEALQDGEDFTITLPSGELYAVRRGDEFGIRRREEIPTVELFECALEMPGVTRITSIGLTIECEVVDGPLPARLAGHEAMIDADSVVGTLRVRSITPGDRIMPFGMTGSKKLQDVFVDKKVPRADRARAAVVVDDVKVLWVVGVVASELGRVTDRTRKAIHVCATRDL